jgi:hypothetical protein
MRHTERYHSYAAITPNDTLASYVGGPFDAIYVGGAGNIVVVDNDGRNVTFSGATAGSIIPIAGSSVRSTSTTATNLVALRG